MNSLQLGSDKSHNNKYVVLMDPLDGSLNIDVNVSVRTIFRFIEGFTPLVHSNNGRFFYNQH
jgi:fructose-1,6-bisphosphatase